MTTTATTENVQELLNFIVNSPEDRLMLVALLGQTIPARKAVSFVSFVAQMSRRYCLANGLHPSNYSFDEIILVASALHKHMEDEMQMREAV
jgi:hypothetical protein